MERVVYDFESFCLDPEERRLLRDGVPVSIGPKIFDLLVLLVEQAGQTMPRETLVQTLWGEDTWADNANVNQAVWLLRKALAPMGSELIETVPKKGYRFRGTVTERVVEAPSSDVISGAVEALDLEKPGWRLPRGRLMVLAAFLVVVLATSILVWRSTKTQPQVSEASENAARARVAVVGFENLSSDAAVGWVASALSHLLVMDLSAGGALAAVPGQEVIRAREELGIAGVGPMTTNQLRSLHEMIGADLVVTGSFLVPGESRDSIRVDLQVQETRSGETVLTTTRNAHLAHISQLASSIGDELRIRAASTTGVPDRTRPE